MNSEKLELFPFVITSVRNPDNCDIISIEIYKEGRKCLYMKEGRYSGTSLLRSPTGLGKSDLNAEVTLLQGVICTVEYNLGLSHGDCNGEVFLLVR